MPQVLFSCPRCGEWRVTAARVGPFPLALRCSRQHVMERVDPRARLCVQPPIEVLVGEILYQRMLGEPGGYEVIINVGTPSDPVDHQGHRRWCYGMRVRLDGANATHVIEMFPDPRFGSESPPLFAFCLERDANVSGKLLARPLGSLDMRDVRLIQKAPQTLHLPAPPSRSLPQSKEG